jgi:hypothetical protein
MSFLEGFPTAPKCDEGNFIDEQMWLSFLSTDNLRAVLALGHVLQDG